MEKNWCVEVWGKIKNYNTEVFFTKREAEAYFKHIRSNLDSTKYIFAKDSITEINNPDNAVYLTDLRDLS